MNKEEIKLVCVNCPKGCNILVTRENGEILEVQGNTCEAGKNYAVQEVTRPMRILTSTVRILEGPCRVLPVITSAEIPLDQMEEAMKEIREIRVHAPVEIGQVLLSNLAGTGVDVLASRSMKQN